MLPPPEYQLRVTVAIDPELPIESDNACKLSGVNRCCFAPANEATYPNHFHSPSEKTDAPNNEETLAA